MKQSKSFNHRFIAICLVVIFLVVFVYVHIQSIKKKRADTKALLRQQEKELEVFTGNIEETKKMKAVVLNTKFWLRFLLRFISICSLFLLNYYYVTHTCGKFGLKDVTEAVINCNAGLLLVSSVFFFFLSGSFMELKQNYIKTELIIIAYFLDKTEKSIETLLAVQEINKQSLLEEIGKTQRLLAELESGSLGDVNRFIQNDNSEISSFSKPGAFDETKTTIE